MSARFAFLEGPARAPAIAAHGREWFAARPPEAHSALVRELMQLPWSRRAWRVPALLGEGEAVLASCFLYELDLRLDGRRLELGGIGALWVRPDLRRLGLGRLLLERVHAWLREQRKQGAFLFSAIGDAYYERLGYVALPGRELSGRFDEHEHPPVACEAELRAYEPRDFAGVRELYNLTSSLQRIALLRTDDYWDYRLERARRSVELGFDPAHAGAFLVAEREGELRAYLRSALEQDGHRLRLLEWGCAAGAHDLLRALIARARELARAPGRAAPRELRAVGPARIANVCGAHALAWDEERENRMLVLPFGSFALPECGFDERVVWASDWF